MRREVGANAAALAKTTYDELQLLELLGEGGSGLVCAGSALGLYMYCGWCGEIFVYVLWLVRRDLRQPTSHP